MKDQNKFQAVRITDFIFGEKRALVLIQYSVSADSLSLGFGIRREEFGLTASLNKRLNYQLIQTAYSNNLVILPGWLSTLSSWGVNMLLENVSGCVWRISYTEESEVHAIGLSNARHKQPSKIKTYGTI